MARKPKTIATFLRPPSYRAWQKELEAGWPGPDGSSMSTDTIMGVRIGLTSPSYEHSDLPANRHDWMYRLARRWRLPEAWRVPADKIYRDLCQERCRKELKGWRRGWLLPLALGRCHFRYACLRAGATFAWTGKAKLRKDAWQHREA
jgi:hypothetical protein